MLGVEHSSLVRLLDNLERDGLIKRIDNKQDKREKHIYLSEQGETMLTELINARRRVMQPVTGLLDEEELQALHLLIEKMTAGVVVGGDDQHYVCRLCELEVCPQEMCPVNLCHEEWYELPEKPFIRKINSARKL